MPDQLKHQPLPLNSDTWHLIFLATPQSDLYSITLTCKTFNALATPLLYRTITLLTPKPTTPEGISRLIHKRTTERQRASDPTNPNRTREYDRARWALLSRLETDQEIRTHVREALLPHSSSRTRYIISLRENRYHRLCRLLLGLPNLQRVKLGCVKVQKDCAPLIRAIAEHPNNPELEVTICETDRRGEFPFTVALSDPLAGAVAEHLMTLACISSLIVTVDPFTYPNGNGRRMRAVQDLFFRCPRLRCFRLTLRNPEMNAISVIDGESYPIVSSFEFPFPRVPGIVEDLELDVGAGAPQSGPGPGLGLVFPPLEELSLDGYRMDDAEWAYWRDGLEWTRLRSLSVGPQSTFGLYEQTLCGTLGQFAGFATALTTLRVHSFAGLDEGGLGGWREGLARLLEAFASLEVLELVGYWPSRAGAICRHRGLKEFTMHVDEMPLKGRERGVFSAEDFVILDRACPELRALEVDVERDGEGGGGEWPVPTITTLATRFKRLRALTLHFELGICDIRAPLRPSLSTISAHRLGRLFFDARRQAGISVSSSFQLILWTGRSYPIDKEDERDCFRFADEYKVRYQVSMADCSCGNDGGILEVRRVEGKSLDIREMAVNPSGVFRG